MAEDVNPDFDRQAKISFAPPAAGSCLTPEILQEIASLIKITLPISSSQGPCFSTQKNNLAQRDGDCIYVPGVTIFQTQQIWSQAAPADLTFSGWSSDIDGLTALVNFFGIFDPGDTSADVVIKSFSATQFTLSVRNSTHDVSIFFRLYQFPVAPEPST